MDGLERPRTAFPEGRPHGPRQPRAAARASSSVSVAGSYRSSEASTGAVDVRAARDVELAVDYPAGAVSVIVRRGLLGGPEIGGRSCSGRAVGTAGSRNSPGNSGSCRIAEAGKHVKLAVDDPGDPVGRELRRSGFAGHGVGRGIVGPKASVNVPGASADSFPRLRCTACSRFFPTPFELNTRTIRSLPGPRVRADLVAGDAGPHPPSSPVPPRIYTMDCPDASGTTPAESWFTSQPWRRGLQGPGVRGEGGSEGGGRRRLCSGFGLVGLRSSAHAARARAPSASTSWMGGERNIGLLLGEDRSYRCQPTRGRQADLKGGSRALALA